tara:strand:- start:13943 stop:15334 length:1392 start_codon:yes stop_codon:yes gene_type:complete
MRTLKEIIMKKRLLILLIPMLVISCGDDFTTLGPISDRNVQNFYQSQSDFEVAMNGVLDALQSNGTFGVNYVLFMEMRADNGANGGGATGLAQSLEFLDTFADQANANEINRSWIASYQGIARANSILSRIDGADFNDNAAKDKLKGEALFVRSLLYYHLAVIFGNVPLEITEVSNPASYKPNQVSASEVFTQIATDLTTAEGLLPTSGRISSYAAAALLGRVYLQSGNPSAAVAPLQRVVASPHDLLPNYADIWGPGNEGNNEIIFEIEFINGNVGEGSSYTDMYTNMGVAGGIGGGGAPQNVTDDFINNAFEAGDARFAVNVDTADGDNVTKFNDTPGAPFDSEVNWVEIRYAEVLLNLAEALGEGLPAYDLINEVRNRAGLADISALTPGTFQEKLLRERRVELAFENKRWPDLLRFGVAKSVMSAQLGIPESQVKLLFPIPQTQIDVAPDEMSQNSEYN